MKKYKEWRQLSFIEEDQVFNWGMYNGKTIIDVINMHPEYISWCLKNVRKFRLGVKIRKFYEQVLEKSLS